MANDISMRLEGASKKNFEELAVRAREKGLKAAATAGGTVITRAIRASVPVDSGLLKKSINKKVKLYRETETAIAVCGARRDVQGEVRGNVRIPAKYIAIVEGGAKPHGYATRSGQHPGFAAKNFIKDAEKSAGGAALEAAQSKLAEVIEREAERLGNA